MKNKINIALSEIEKIKEKEKIYLRDKSEINTSIIKFHDSHYHNDYINHKKQIINECLNKSLSIYEMSFKSMISDKINNLGDDGKKDIKSIIDAYNYGAKAIREKIENETIPKIDESNKLMRIDILNSMIEAEKNNYEKIKENAMIAISEASKVFKAQKKVMRRLTGSDALEYDKNNLSNARKIAASTINKNIEISGNKFNSTTNAKIESNRIIKEARDVEEVRKETRKVIHEVNRSISSQRKAIKAMIDSQKDLMNMRSSVAINNILQTNLSEDFNTEKKQNDSNHLIDSVFLLETLERLYSNEITMGEVVKELRMNSLKINQDEFGKLTKTSRKTISDFENNVANLSEKKIQDIIKPFGLKLTLIPE